MDLLGFDLNLADMDERFPILVQYGIYNRDLMPYKSDDFNQLIFVMGGTAEYCSDSETHDVKPGTVCIIGKSTLYHFRNCKQLNLCKIIYKHGMLSMAPPDIRQTEGVTILKNIKKDSMVKLQLSFQTFKCAKHLINEMTDAYEQSDVGRNTLVNSLFWSLVVLLMRVYQSGNDISRQELELTEIIGYIQEHYQETISIKELAEQMNMSPRNFSRIFHKTCGLSPVNYIIKLRIDHACELLQNSSLTVSQVAYACGFQDSNYFTRQFKGISGFSPRDYRRSFR